jgi:hypothetical protein
MTKKNLQTEEVDVVVLPVLWPPLPQERCSAGAAAAGGLPVA